MMQGYRTRENGVRDNCTRIIIASCWPCIRSSPCTRYNPPISRQRSRAMGFLQDAPQLPHPLRADRLLQQLLSHALPAERRAASLPDLETLGDYAVMAWERHLRTPRETPVHTPWDAWGRRVDRVRLTETWREGAAITTRHGVLATGHDVAIG